MRQGKACEKTVKCLLFHAKQMTFPPFFVTCILILVNTSRTELQFCLFQRHIPIHQFSASPPYAYHSEYTTPPSIMKLDLKGVTTISKVGRSCQI